jgi:two-component system, OmpR family, sensor kinase
MKFGPLDLPSLPALTLPRLPLSAFRRRIVFHAVFLLLALAVVGLALTLLAEEKQRARPL